jgi:hypothetical protein
MTRTGLIGRTLTGTIRGVRAMDHAAGRLLGRRRVLVDARSPLNFAVMAPLVAALRRDDRVDVDLTSDGRDDITFSCTGVGFGGAVDALMGLAESLRLPYKRKQRCSRSSQRAKSGKSFSPSVTSSVVASSASVVGSSAIVLSKWSTSESNRQSDPGNKAEQAGALHNV